MVLSSTKGVIVRIDAQAASKDKAIGLLATNHIAFAPNSVEAKRVLRKVNLRIVPMVLCVHTLIFVVRS
jgi:hypothetical protein